MHEEYIKNLFNNCNVCKLLGIEVYDLTEGHAKGKLTISREHINVFGTVHGGMLFTLADRYWRCMWKYVRKNLCSSNHRYSL